MTKSMKLLVIILAGLVLLPIKALAVHVKSDRGLDLKTEKVVSLLGEINPITAAAFEKRMLETMGIPGDRLILIDSPGGMVDQGLRMIHALETERALGIRIVCVVDRHAHSMAFNLLTHCDIRLAVPKAMMLAHKVRRYGVCNGTAKVLRAWADDLDKTDEPFRQANAAAMKLTVPEYDAFADEETMWRAETLYRRGYLHGLVTVTK